MIDHEALKNTVVVPVNERQSKIFWEEARVNCHIELPDDMYYDYLEEGFIDGPWARHRDYRYWVLVERQDQEEQNRALSYCCTCTLNILVKKPDGQISQERGYAMEAVHTPKPLRGKGYATHMLRQMHYICSADMKLWPKSFGAPPATTVEPGLASILSSHVDPKLYEQCWIGEESDKRGGWMRGGDRMNLQYSLKLKETADSPKSQEPKDRSWTWVYAKDFPELAGPLGQYAKSRLQGVESSDMVIARDFNEPNILTRFDSFSRLVFNPDNRPRYDPDEKLGIRFFPKGTPSSFDATQPIILFCPEVTPSECYITLMAKTVPELLDFSINKIREVNPSTNSITGIGLDPVLDRDLLAHMEATGFEVKIAETPFCGAWYGSSENKPTWTGLEWWTVV